MTKTTTKIWLVRWLYGIAAVHLIIGLLLPWIGQLAIVDGYHRHVEAAFWGMEAPAAARMQQAWWIALFGPTIQSLSLWMGALVYFGDKYKSVVAWGMLIAGILLWAPQDIAISLRANAWIHVWIDAFALLTMLPPLFVLWREDRRSPLRQMNTEAA